MKLDCFGLYNILGGLNEIGTISFRRVYAQCNFLKKIHTKYIYVVYIFYIYNLYLKAYAYSYRCIA